MSGLGRHPPGGFDQPCPRTWVHGLLRDPPTDDEITVPGELVLYKRRSHWLSLQRTVKRSLALLVVAVQLVLGLDALSIVTVVPVVAALVVLWRWAKRHELWELAAIGAVLILVGVGRGGLSSVGAVLAIWSWAYFAVKVLEWRCYAFLYVTNRRLVATKGILQRDVSTMPIAKITDVKLRVTWFAEWLGDLPFAWAETYGEFSVESAGQNQALGRLPYLADPYWFNETVLLLATSAASMEDDGT